jgi:hypothetical protein
MGWKRAVMLVAAVCLVVGAGVPSLSGVAAAQPSTFGTSDEIAHTVNAWEFGEPNPGRSSDTTTFGGRYCVLGACSFISGLRLPAGALLSRIELDGCDDNPAAEIKFELFRTDAPATTGSLVKLTTTGTTGASSLPGCGIFSVPVIAPFTIDNQHFNYVLQVSITTDSFDINFTAVRVYYTLQVSPAPATASFTDVPTGHPFFQFVEALVASGITAGCGGGNYCPDQAVTRGQMAVFLSKALGLHFAP